MSGQKVCSGQLPITVPTSETHHKGKMMCHSLQIRVLLAMAAWLCISGPMMESDSIVRQDGWGQEKLFVSCRLKKREEEGEGKEGRREAEG